MSQLNSGQLRAKLDKNVSTMNRLTEQNDEIVKLLSSRGLKPAVGADCLMVSVDRLKIFDPDGLGGLGGLQWPQKPEPLTTGELKAGGFGHTDSKQ